MKISASKASLYIKDLVLDFDCKRHGQPVLKGICVILNHLLKNMQPRIFFTHTVFTRKMAYQQNGEHDVRESSYRESARAMLSFGPTESANPQ